jgi:hypothetical protein
MRARRVHALLAVAWAVMMPVAYFTGWVYSVAFVSVISIYANFVSHWGAHQASRAEDAASSFGSE